jgi:hypothetical protein
MAPLEVDMAIDQRIFVGLNGRAAVSTDFIGVNAAEVG